MSGQPGPVAASIAALPASSANVSVGPPLSCRGPSLGSPGGPASQSSSPVTLPPWETNAAPVPVTQSTGVLPATIEFAMTNVLGASSAHRPPTPPRLLLELPDTVELSNVNVPPPSTLSAA